MTMPSSTLLGRFTLPATTPRCLLVGLALLLAGCGVPDEERTLLQSEARQDGHGWPAVFGSTEAAITYANASPGGGRVDEVRIDPDSFLVVFRHGSGIHVIGIAVYRRNLGQWELVARPPRRAYGDFLRATAVEGKIVATGVTTGTTWVLYDPHETKS